MTIATLGCHTRDILGAAAASTPALTSRPEP